MATKYCWVTAPSHSRRGGYKSLVVYKIQNAPPLWPPYSRLCGSNSSCGQDQGIKI